MRTEDFEQAFKFNKDLSGTFTEWNKSATEMLRHVTQQNLELLGENFTRFSNQLNRLSTARKPEEFFTLQTECLKENTTAAVSNLQKIIHLNMENFELLTKLCGTTLRDSTYAATKTAEKTTRQTEK